MKNICGILLLGLFALGACSSWEVDDVQVDLNGRYAIPLGHTSLSMGDFLNLDSLNGETLIDTSGLIRLQYKSEKVVVHGDEIMPSLPIGIPLPLTDTLIEVTIPEINGLSISKATLSGEQMTFSFISNHSQDILVTLCSPSFVKDGEIFEEEFIIPYLGITPVFLTTDPISLDGYTLNTPDQKIQFSYRSTDSTGAFRSLASVLFTISRITFETYEGGIPRLSVSLPIEKVGIDFFRAWSGGEVFVEDPEISVLVENSFGAEGAVILDEVIITGTDNIHYLLESDLLNQQLFINYPSLEEKNETKITQFRFDPENSNIETLFSVLPKALEYRATGILNPDEQNTIYSIRAQDSIAMQAVVNLPLQGYIHEAVLTDTLDFAVDFATDIRDAELSVVVQNELPIGVSLQMDLIDGNGADLGSLFENTTQVVSPAAVNENGEVIFPTEFITKIPLSDAILDDLKFAKQVIVLATFMTDQSASKAIVKVKNNQMINIQLGLLFSKN